MIQKRANLLINLVWQRVILISHPTVIELMKLPKIMLSSELDTLKLRNLLINTRLKEYKPGLRTQLIPSIKETSMKMKFWVTLREIGLVESKTEFKP